MTSCFISVQIQEGVLMTGGLFIDSVHTSVQRTGTVEPR